MADTPEKKIKKKAAAVLKEYNIWHFFPQSGIYGRSGVPDIVGIMPGGRAIAIEVKAGSSYGLTALQEKTLKEMGTAGAFVMVVKGEEGVEKLRATLQAFVRIGV